VFGVYVRVRINDLQQATDGLQNFVLPQVRQMPGLVTGYWLHGDETTGVSLVVFQTREQAEEMVKLVEGGPGLAVTVEAASVHEVIAHT
jgi:hypothetical protein